MGTERSESEADSPQSDDDEVQWDEEIPQEAIQDAVSLNERIQEGHITIVDDSLAEVLTFFVPSDDRNIWRNCLLPMPSCPF
jgi:hypothetical protein